MYREKEERTKSMSGKKKERKERKAQVIDWQECKLTVTGISFLF